MDKDDTAAVRINGFPTAPIGAEKGVETIRIYIYIYLMCSFIQGTYVHLHATLISVALDGRQLHGSNTQCLSGSRYICWKQMIYHISMYQYTFSP